MKTETTLSPEMEKELRLIMEDNYSRGAFTGMITNLYINNIQTDKPLGADIIIQQAIMVRLLAKSMAGLLQKPKQQTTEEELCINDDKPKLKLVM